MFGTQFDLTVRVAPVTAGSKGPGGAMAWQFAGAGRCRDLRPVGGRAQGCRRGDRDQDAGEWVVADLSCRDEAMRLARKAQSAFGRIDILANNFGSDKP